MEREPEIWKPIIGYEGLYEISSYGKLKRLAGYSPRKRKGYSDDEIFHREIILKNHYHRKGYVINDLFNFVNGIKIRKGIKIHRLVGIMFLPKPIIEKNQINHKNGIKDDNYFGNLEWCTNLENQDHATENDLRGEPIRSWKNKQSVSVKKINLHTGESIEVYGSIAEAERITGIQRTNIKKVCRGKRQSAGGFYWQYKSN